jgi:ADP-ribose pyrophosphatase YjhB (NUDIX family)
MTLFERESNPGAAETSSSGPDLEAVPTSGLLIEVLRRKHDLLDNEGFLSPEAFKLADFLGTRVCVDGVPARLNEEGEVELMAIERNTGPYAGQLALVGGGVGRVRENDSWAPESLEQALRRHFRVDLGLDIEPLSSWQQPAYIAQDMRPVDGALEQSFTPNDNSRHLVAARYLVKIVGKENPVFGTTTLGGQEAAAIAWFSEAAMPPPDAFGYGHRETFEAMFPAARQLLNATK